jgi:hypothetical protein
VHGLLLLLPAYTQKQPLCITDELLQRIEVEVGEVELASTTNSAV